MSGLFDVTGKTGVGPAIDGLFTSFSQLSVNPNDVNARQDVINQASQVANAFRSANLSVQNATSEVSDEARANINAINKLAGTIAQINGQHPQDYKGNTDGGVDAQLNSTLEELSKYVNYSAIQQPDGSVTVYLGGQTPLVIGDKTNPIQGDFSSPQVKVLDGQGFDITSQLKQGQLAGVLDVKNTKLPSYLADLNTLAQGIADQVNTALSNGVDANGAVPSKNLFTYNALAASQTLAVDPTFTQDQVAAALPGSPGGTGMLSIWPACPMPNRSPATPLLDSSAISAAGSDKTSPTLRTRKTHKRNFSHRLKICAPKSQGSTSTRRRKA